MHGSRTRTLGACDGYVLAEMTLALLVMGLIAALALPSLPHADSPASLRATAYQIAGLLRDQRTAAQSMGREAVAVVDRGTRRLALPSGVALALPIGVAFGGGSSRTIRFSSEGRSSGGIVVLQGGDMRLAVVVSTDTGAIDVTVP